MDFKPKMAILILFIIGISLFSGCIASSSRVITPPGGGGGISSYMYSVWAEENAALGANSYEWAFGNGANSPADGGLTIYVPNGWNCSVVAMSLRVGGGTANVTLLINGVEQLADGCVEIASGQSASNEFTTPLYLNDNDYINFRTKEAAGTSGPCVVTAWIKMVEE